MRRTLIAALAVATLAFAAVALAAPQHYRGPIRQGGYVTFQTQVKQHQKRVKGFYFFKLKLICEKAPQGANPTIKISNKSPLNFPIPPMAVKRRQFHGGFYKADFKTRGEVEGRFSDRNRKAAGTLRVHGRPLGSAYGKCDSGTVRWAAKKQ
jgi:hypothetical protein